MARAMFEYTKAVLEKVSFNKHLFCKELDNSLKRLLPFEIKELYLWLVDFTNNKPELISCVQLVKAS